MTDRARGPTQITPICIASGDSDEIDGAAQNGGSVRGYLGVGEASQQSRHGLLDGRLFCISIHCHPRGECPHLPLVARLTDERFLDLIPVVVARAARVEQG
jgi:hypothetical protein